MRDDNIFCALEQVQIFPYQPNNLFITYSHTIAKFSTTFITSFPLNIYPKYQIINKMPILIYRLHKYLFHLQLTVYTKGNKAAPSRCFGADTRHWTR